MKCDDDTFVRVDVVVRHIKLNNGGRPLYMGNLNLLHRPLRMGKWTVTTEVIPSVSVVFPQISQFNFEVHSFDSVSYSVYIWSLPFLLTKETIYSFATVFILFMNTLVTFDAGVAWRHLSTLCKWTRLCDFWWHSEIRRVSACQPELKGELPMTPITYNFYGDVLIGFPFWVMHCSYSRWRT